MKFQISIFIVVAFFFVQINCKKEPPIVPPIDPPAYKQSIFLSVTDSGLTEIYLNLSITDTLPPRGFEIFRNNVKVLSGSLFTKETTLVDMTVQMNTSYTYQAFRVDDTIRKDSSAVIATKTLDTTSHEFMWSEHKFGNWSNNVLRDVEIESDALFYAVGEIHQIDSSGNESRYNGIKYSDGMWSLIRLSSNAQILYPGSIGSDSLLVAGGTLKILSNNDIWFAAGVMHHIKGSSWIQQRAEGAGFGSEMWGYDDKNIWVVSGAGYIIKYDGTSWIVQPSGTDIQLKDIWGTSDGSTLWACGYSSDNMRSVLLEYKTGSWQTLWSREGTIPNIPFGYRVTSVWYKRSLYLCNSNAVFRTKDAEITQISPSFSWQIHQIRGNDENDIVVVTEESAIWHFNGKNWKKVYQNSNQLLESIAIRGNTIVAVGNDLSTFPAKAVIIVGKRY